MSAAAIADARTEQPGPSVQKTVELNDLRFGHEFPGRNLNSRRTDLSAGIDVLAKNLDQVGLLIPLAVVSMPGSDILFVFDGNRRLAAMKAAKWPAETAVPVIVHDVTAVEALEGSIVANVFRANLHPVDQYEAMAELREQGSAPAAIGAAFGLKPIDVERILALGALAPEIRAAWRKGDIEEHHAKDFTLAPDHARQVAIYNKLKKGRSFWQVRQEIVGALGDGNMLMRFVGEKAYTDAGGKLIRDLFARDADSGAIPEDRELVKRLADEKIAEKIAGLLKQGWSWACRLDELPNGARYSWPTTKDKKKGGAVVQIDHDGKLDVVAGLMKPAEAKAAKKAAGKAASGVTDTDAGPMLASALLLRQTEALTLAVADIISRSSFDIGLQVIVWAHTAGRYQNSGPLQASARGMTASANLGDKTFKDALKVDANAAVPAIAAQMVDCRMRNPAALDGDGFAADVRRLLSALPSNIALPLLRDAFAKVAEDFFSGAPKAIALEAIKEVVDGSHRPHHERLATAKKSDVVAFAVEHVVKAGWLPTFWRPLGYKPSTVVLSGGPEAAKAKPPAKKPAKAKPDKKAKAKPAKAKKAK